MWRFGNFKEKYGTLYRGLKFLASLLPRDAGFCFPKQIAGHFVWTRPWLMSADAPEPHVIQWIQQSLSPGGTFFDIGAHYGWMSIAAANCVRARGRVVAFEPSPVLLDVLRTTREQTDCSRYKSCLPQYRTYRIQLCLFI